MLRNSITKIQLDEPTKKEIALLKDEMEALAASTTICKHEKRDLKQILKNNTVVWKEFQRSLDEKNRILSVVTDELETLKDLLAKKQREFENYTREAKVLQEVVDTKKRESDEAEKQILEHKETILANHNKMIQVRAIFEAKQFGEWKTVLDDWALDGGTSITKTMVIKNMVEERIVSCQGIPDSFRGEVWRAITPFNATIRTTESLFQNINQLYYHLLETPSPMEKTIQKDILRSFPDDEFRQRMMENDRCASLFNTLKAYSNLDPTLGYCQGMNFVVSFLLLYFNQEDTFWMLCMIMQQYKMVGLYQQGRMLPFFLDHFDNEIKVKFPLLHEHMIRENVSPVMYVTEWFTCMFVYNLSRDTVAKIWDLFYYGNGQQELFRVGLAILTIYYEDLLVASMEGILRLLKRKARHINAQKLISTTLSIRLNPITIDFLNSLDAQWSKQDGIRKLVVRRKQYIITP